MHTNITKLRLCDGESEPHPLDFRAAVRAELYSDQFAELMSEILGGQPAAPRFINAKRLAECLGVSPATVTRLKREGLPHLIVGQEARFDEEECVTWLRTRQESGCGQ